MKKILLMAASWMIFSGCAKDVASPDEQSQAVALKADQTQTGGIKPVRTNATIHKSGDQREGGIGWYMQVNAYEWEVPLNLPEQYQVEGIRVDVAYVRTDKPVPNYSGTEKKYMVEIKDISRIKDGENR